MRVYFDNAATTPIAEEVLAEMIPVLQSGFGNPSSIHAEGRRARAMVEQARKTVAKCIGAGTGEIFFTSGGTESNNTAIKCAVRDLGVRRIISCPTEHHCNLHSFDTVVRESAVKVEMLSVDAHGRISLEELENVLARENTPTLVSLMHGNNEIGTMIDLDEIAEICLRYNAYFHSDTVQTVGRFPIDVSKTPVHFLAGSSHKFHGPKGIGFLYIHPDIRIKAFIDGGSQERNMRGGTENVYGMVGLSKAIELACENMEARRTQIESLRAYLKSRLQESFPDIRFNGDVDGRRLYTVLSASFPPSPINEMLLFNLDIAGISASGGSACTSGTEKGSHVLEAVGADPDRRSVRFSLSHYNTPAEVDFVVEKLQGIFSTVKKSFALTT